MQKSKTQSASETRQYRIKKCENCKAKNLLTSVPSQCPKCGEYPGFVSTYSACPHNPVHAWSERGVCIKMQAKKRKRAKQVFSTGEIPHLWAHKVQSSARNPQGNLFFENGTIYSYGLHFPIAAHVQNKRKKDAILFTTRSYSVTTSQHIGQVRSAIPHGVRVFHVSDVDALSRWNWSTPERGHTRNAESYVSELNETINKAQKSRTLYHKEWRTKRAKELRKELLSYVAFFGLKRPKNIPDVPKLTPALVRKLKAREAFLASDAHRSVLVVERARREMNAEFAQRRASADAIAEWRAGNPYARVPWNTPTMLRIKGNEVETSQGARVPVEHAKRVLAIVRRLVAEHREFVTNGHTIPIGVYKVDRIDADGTLHAGCHHIAFSEIERLGLQLDAMPTPTETQA